MADKLTDVGFTINAPGGLYDPGGNLDTEVIALNKDYRIKSK
ncbi:hypothetical protein [Candidatus Magnetobacterium casense]|nr:hypothetical protein [Candidatus Magnetobacterium casensis]